MGLLHGKALLVTGVTTRASIAFHTARVAQLEGARVVLTAHRRPNLVRLLAAQLPVEPAVVELDVTDADQLATLEARLREHVDRLDGVLHAVAFSPPSGLGGDVLRTPWRDAAEALHVSAFSLQSLTTAVLPLLAADAAVVGLDFDASVTWPGYNWMGIAKAALESCARYLARDLGPRGIRVNLVSAGPLRTLAASGEPDFAALERDFAERAPLGWDATRHEAVARACVALLSSWFPATTGEIVHVDGGAHAIGVTKSVPAPPDRTTGWPGASTDHGEGHR